MSGFKVVVPARVGSSRLPGKVLEDIGGEPMAVRVARIGLEAGADEVVIATDSDWAFGVFREAFTRRFTRISVAMTDPALRCGTERCAVVARMMEWDDRQVVVNLQGDEPLMAVENVQAAATLAEQHWSSVSTLVWRDQLVSGVTAALREGDDGKRALWFSRQRISDDVHMGIYGYRVFSLRNLAALEPTEAENRESLEQLRWLQHGVTVNCRYAPKPPGRAVDTAEDLEAVRRMVAGDG